MVRCPSCGKSNNPLNQFCDDCGVELRRQTASSAPQQRQTTQQMILCPHCRAASPAGSKVCLRCGKPFPLSPGVVLNHRYRVDALLSVEGGMGVIYKVADFKAGNLSLALKECSPKDQTPANPPLSPLPDGESHTRSLLQKLWHPTLL